MRGGRLRCGSPATAGGGAEDIGLQRGFGGSDPGFRQGQRPEQVLDAGGWHISVSSQFSGPFIEPAGVVAGGFFLRQFSPQFAGVQGQ